MPIARNVYRRKWLDAFARSVDDDATASEVAFLQRALPLEAFPRVLDLACGAGRHAAPLSRAGYEMVGIDRDEGELLLAQRAARAGARFLCMDMRDAASLDGPFDACVCMWSVFGLFDDEANERLLRSVAGLLRAGGRLVIDSPHPEAQRRREGMRRYERAGVWINETVRVEGDRLHVQHSYDGGVLMDAFEHRLYAPEELADLCRRNGLSETLRCAGFDERAAPTPEQPRMQMVFERG